MGELAKIGIWGGQRIPVDNVLKGFRRGVLNHFERGSLAHFDSLILAEKVASGETLSVKEVEFLLSGASLNLLCKLVKVRARVSKTNEPSPVLAIPFGDWVKQYGLDGTCEKASQEVGQINHEDLHVYLSDLSPAHLLDDCLSKIEKLISECNRVTFVAPGVDDLAGDLSASMVKTVKGYRRQLSSVLENLKTTGFSKLRGSKRRMSIRLVDEAGFPVSVCTYLDAYPNKRILAEELLSLNALAEEENRVSVWIPGLRKNSVEPANRVETDMELLRLLAVGSIALPAISYYRSSSAFLSLEALSVAHLFGATDFGFGSVNDSTEACLNLKPYTELQDVRACSMRNAK